MEKVLEFMLGFGIVWIAFWATAVDTPGEGGILAMKMVMLGVLILAVILAICYFWEKNRPPKRSKNNITNK